MVDVVGGKTLVAVVQTDDVAHRADDVLIGQRGGVVLLGGEAELLIHLVAADLREIVALRIEEQAIEQRAGAVDGRRLAGTEALVQLDERLFLRGGRVAVEGAQHHLGGTEQLDDLLAGLGQTKRAHEQRGRLLALAVDAHTQQVALVGFELEPRTAGGDHLRVVDGLVGGLVALGGEVHARATDELGHHDALGTINNEGAARGHEREVAHEHLLLLNLAGLTVDEADLDEERRLIGDVLLLAFIHRVLGLAELMLAELDTHVARIVLNGAHVGEGLSQAFILEPIEAFRLDSDQVRDVHHVRNLREASAIPVKAGGSGFFSLSHEAVPPSRPSQICKKVAIR